MLGSRQHIRLSKMLPVVFKCLSVGTAFCWRTSAVSGGVSSQCRHWLSLVTHFLPTGALARPKLNWARGHMLPLSRAPWVKVHPNSGLSRSTRQDEAMLNAHRR